MAWGCHGQHPPLLAPLRVVQRRGGNFWESHFWVSPSSSRTQQGQRARGALGQEEAAGLGVQPQSLSPGHGVGCQGSVLGGFCWILAACPARLAALWWNEPAAGLGRGAVAALPCPKRGSLGAELRRGAEQSRGVLGGCWARLQEELDGRSCCLNPPF